MARSGSSKIMNEELGILDDRIKELEIRNEELFDSRRDYIKLSNELFYEVAKLRSQLVQPTEDTKLNPIYTQRINELVSKNEQLNKWYAALQSELENVKQERGEVYNRLNKELRELKSKYYNQQPMYYEDKNAIIFQIMELFNVEDNKIHDKLDEILEPYTNGTYGNYN